MTTSQVRGIFTCDARHNHGVVSVHLAFDAAVPIEVEVTIRDVRENTLVYRVPRDVLHAAATDRYAAPYGTRRFSAKNRRSDVDQLSLRWTCDRATDGVDGIVDVLVVGAEVREFLDRTFTQVPTHRECAALDLDRVIRRILEGV